MQCDFKLSHNLWQQLDTECIWIQEKEKWDWEIIKYADFIMFYWEKKTTSSTQWQGTHWRKHVGITMSVWWVHLHTSVGLWGSINCFIDQFLIIQCTFCKANTWQKSPFPHKIFNTLYITVTQRIHIQWKCQPRWYIFMLHKLCIVH